MTPVRVKLYGLIPITRKRYLIQVGFALFLAAVLLVAWFLYWPTVRNSLRAANSPTLDRIVVFWNLAPVVVGSIVVLQAIEAWIVLRLFARKSAAAIAAPPGPTI